MGDTRSDKQSSLEDQLRQMILSNVTISDPSQPNQDAPHGPRHQNRRPFHQGSSLNSRRHSNQVQSTQISVPGRKNDFSFDEGRRNQQRNPRGQAHPQNRGRADIVNRNENEQNPTTRHQRYPTRRQHPPQQQDQFQQDGQPTYQHSSAPKILQRPQRHAGPHTHTPANPISQYTQRNSGYPMQLQNIPQNQHIENAMAQSDYLEQTASQEVPKVEITLAELEEKETFRRELEHICKNAVAQSYSGPMATIDLVGFGSLASGFGMPGSDMDLAIVPVWKEPSKSANVEIDRDIPRLLEKAVLDCKMGGRLLTRTRVPILKVCQKPTEQLFTALYDERKKWDELPEEEKYPALPPSAEPTPSRKPSVEENGEKLSEQKQPQDPNEISEAWENLKIDVETSKQSKLNGPKSSNSKRSNSPTSAKSTLSHDATNNSKEDKPKEKPWLREKALGPLDFPKIGIGIQCDLNFENPLGIHNTHLLRCYSLTDPRVRPMVLFVKSWAKQRKINSSYSGTLSSYGWVLMVLHYLVNVVKPPVCPNLQHCWRPPIDMNGLEKMFKDTKIGGYEVRFWRNEQEIMNAARSGHLTHNTQPLGALLRGFFHYYASPPATGYPRPASFYWTTEVLSLRTPGGIRMKSEKGWTGATTKIIGGKEVRNRYLFAIEDPFELDHNVARTVTHNGIVAIRDEFRRAWRIISAVGRNMPPEGGLFDEVVEQAPAPTPKEEKKAVVSIENVVLANEEDGQGTTGAGEAKAEPTEVTSVATQNPIAV